MAITWQTLKVGAGGFVTGGDIAANGTKICRTDVGGGYRWNGSAWIQLVTTASMPALYSGEGAFTGIYEICIAPSNTARFYMLFGTETGSPNQRVFRTEDSGTTWAVTNFAAVQGCGSNDQSGVSPRTFGRKIAVDPNNADVCYVGTALNGLRVTDDAGATWATVGDVPTSANNGGVLIAFDSSSSVVGGKTQIIYASSYGNGVYQTTNGGTSWTLTTSSPTTHRHVICDQAGSVYLCDNSGGATSLQRFESGSWATVTGAGAAIVVAVDPADVNHITCGRGGGEISSSANHGTTWTGYPNNTPLTTWTSTDIPWLAWALTNSIGFMSTGDIRYDPSQSNKVFFFEGIGVWTITPPASGGIGLAWVTQSAGIEELVANQIICPPGGKPVTVCWDRPFFYLSNPTRSTYPSTYGPTADFNFGAAIDWASSNPTFLIGAADTASGKSTDGGQTWAAFASEAPQGNGGCIAASTTTNYVWVPSNSPSAIFFTTNGGTSWGNPTGLPSNGWPTSFAIDRHIVCADRVTANKFYLYNNSPTLAGIYTSTDSGATWTRTRVGFFASEGVDGFAAKLRTVPNNAGNLFYSAGDVGGSVTGSFYKCTDGGTTFNAVANVLEVRCFGFGAAKPGGVGYPAIFIVGWVNGIADTDYGIWQSDDASASWFRIATFPNNSFDTIKWIEGDMNTYGTVYLGMQGTGFLVGSEDSSAPVALPRFRGRNFTYATGDWYPVR